MFPRDGTLAMGDVGEREEPDLQVVERDPSRSAGN
jgi:hypothetical protein